MFLIWIACAMKILIVDDHPLFLVGLRQVFVDNPHPIEALEAHDHKSALTLIEQRTDIDWIFLDLQIPGGDGATFITELAERKISIPVAILSANEEPAVIHQALHAGASAYLSKSMAKAELVTAFNAIRTRGHYISETLRQPLDDYRASIGGRRAPGVRLTRRQREVLRHLARGDSNQSIAVALNIAESTVKGHVSTLFDLLQVENRAGCTRVAMRLGLID
jgi:DNA-binding NarL/FixJ family response regulator